MTTAQINAVQHHLNEYKGLQESPHLTLTPLSLVEIPHDDITLSELMPIFVSYYGERLCNHLFKQYVPEGKDIFLSNDIRLLIAAAAADVHEADLISLHVRNGGTIDSFKELTPEHLSTLLDHFRSGPAGQDLLEYLNIPVDNEKQTVTEEFLAGFSESLPEERRLKYAVCRFADLESIKIWQPNQQASCWSSEPLLQESENDRCIPEGTRHHLRMPEYFARKIAYIHGPHTQEGAPIQNLRATVVPVYESDRKVFYQIHYVYADGGFIFQTLLPVDPLRYIQEKRHIPVVITFQGTDFGSWASARRDIDLNPGSHDWTIGRGGEALLENLMRATSKIRQHHQEAHFEVKLTGHSLGGADAQNAGAHLAKAMLSNLALRNTVANMQVLTFSAPGCSEDSALTYSKAYSKAPRKFKPVIHSLIDWDIVAIWGSCKLGRGTDAMMVIKGGTPKIETSRSVQNIFIRHTEYLYSSGTMIRPLESVAPESDGFDLYTQGASNSIWKFVTKGFRYVVDQ